MDRLISIFENHRRLMGQFKEIERQTTPLGDLSTPVNLQTYAGQARVREEIGRVSEEVSEVLAADPAELVEEVADVLSFLIELFITIGVTPEKLHPHCGDPAHDSLHCVYSKVSVSLQLVPWMARDHWYRFVIMAWHWAHGLKAKPWKLNPKPTNEGDFRDVASEIFQAFILCCYLEGISAEELFEAYVAKSATNQDRITANV